MTRRLVLVGAGHAHALVLKAWASQPLAQVQLIVVSPHPLAPYSGMVPGWLAGTYRYEDTVIDFARLAQEAGAQWIPAQLNRLDPQQQRLELSNGEQLPYDLLSLNTGSTLTPPQGEFAAQVLALRPLADLHTPYENLLARWRSDDHDRPFRVTAVGGGAAGFETLLAVLRRLRSARPDRHVEGALLTRSPTILPGYPRAAQSAAQRALQGAGVQLQLTTAWTNPVGNRSDLVLWATGAQPHAWQRAPQLRGALATSPEGFICIDRQLRSVSHPQVFAVGDCAQWAQPLPKAGVYAVRMGPVLLHNLKAALTNQPMRAFTPQTAFLSLLSTSDGQAIATRGAWSSSGRWAERLKNHIDRRFVGHFAPSISASTLARNGLPTSTQGEFS